MPVSPDISVIIAAYNVDHYIEKAVKSALAQSDFPQAPAIEIIVVDDGSTDRTWEIVSRITDPRLKRLQLTSNSGPGAARNAGIALASGRWIAVLDGDDAFLPGRLARLMKLAASRKADIVVDNLSVFREACGATSPMFSSSRLARLPQMDLSDFLEGNQSFMGGYAFGYMKPVFSAAFLRKHDLHYNTDLRIGEDYLLLAQALAMGANCAVDPAMGYSYTSRAGSTSCCLKKADVQRIAAGDEILLKYKLPPEATAALKRRQGHLKEVHAYICLVDALKSRNFRHVVRAAAASPLTVRHLWRPAWVRLRKITPRFNQKGKITCPQ